MSKKTVDNVASTVIIVREENPFQLFAELKDSSHPRPLVRGALCTPGGNWVHDARFDSGPRDTHIREIWEEFTFNRLPRDQQELAALGLSEDACGFQAATQLAAEPTPKDRATLAQIRNFVAFQATPWMARINTITEEAWASADPDNKKPTMSFWVNYFVVKLPEELWLGLMALQEHFGNLSAECISYVTNAEKMAKTSLRGAFCHDFALEAFWKENGFCKNLTHIPGTSSVVAGIVPETYANLLEKVNVRNHP
ncbi:MAG: hypothetical protein COU10_03295 [Candidatus Harrisonbacteria bacterium CG10_big_fil_rev_8_21_14_0_10_45_28]|uniref:Uncharacterized protein n=1 Tax=Candidatus Harrisonbacteria bacterium CG10_big_fil_rev_8_21_14_0_10_45_28 TaxID=1974586 RepID=A0A2H0UMM5_9BACT|nr:MAG: hypothetical protein COU10_03295 [Candidatus Harrisonbacteria bacterium CG10_big_fil_rev_8_21_14_0_10_45_28]